MPTSEPFKTVDQFKEEIANLKDKLNKINKIADDARNGVHPADWRKDWQRNEWTKVRDLATV